ncbi:MAG: FAD-dependent oxidoreductase [Planctomycetaceae bacterium]|nr:FAD-dependent oxidoreductase [Planctomycetaceae bacterium]
MGSAHHTTSSILIVGGGIAGLATAYHLGRAGARDVHLVEGHAELAGAASARSAAILRTVIEEPTTAALARRSKPHFLSPPEGFGTLLPRRGLVLMANWKEAAEELARLCTSPDYQLEPLDPARLKALAPHIATQPLVAFYSPDDGVIDVAELVRGFAAGARAGGVHIETGARVVGLRKAGGRVVGVQLEDGSERRAERVVLAAGAWAARLAREAGSGIELQPTRRHLLVTEPEPGLDPDWPVVWNGGDTFYSRPEGGGLMLSVCDEVHADPDLVEPLPELARAIAEGAARHLVGVGTGPAARFWVGLRTLTADDRFAVGDDPDVPGLSFAAGLGGHGMSTSFETGRLAAAHLLGKGAAEDLLPALDPARLVRRKRDPSRG